MRVAFIGTLHAGKSSAATEIIRLHVADDETIVLKSFARPLKNRVMEFVRGTMGINITEEAFKRTNLGRRFYQIVGELGRSIDPDYWVKLLPLDEKHIVIDDCRYINEADYLRRNGFTLVRITRPYGAVHQSVTNMLREQDPELTQEQADAMYSQQVAHSSEIEHFSIQCDREIHAESMVDLIEQVGQLYKEEKNG